MKSGAEKWPSNRTSLRNTRLKGVLIASFLPLTLLVLWELIRSPSFRSYQTPFSVNAFLILEPAFYNGSAFVLANALQQTNQVSCQYPGTIRRIH